MSSPRQALIVGAGIGGLAAGVSLQRAGWRVLIYEKAPNPRELGFGLLLAPNAIRALSALGLADAIDRPREGAVEVRRANGEVLRRLNAQIGGPSVVALRQQLHGALLAAVGADSLRLGSNAIGFAQHDGAVLLHLGDGGTARGDVLIGADGVGSIIRRQLHPGEPSPTRSGYCALRGVAFGVSEELRGLVAVGYLDHGVEAATARAGTDGVYWYMSLLTDEVEAAAGRDVGSGMSPHEILPRYLARFDTPFRRIVAATRPDDVRFDELFVREPLSSWGTGSVTLLGDAAHPVLPHTGQGAAQALEDAVALGSALAAGEEVAPALRRYEAAAMRRAVRFIRLGPRIARVTTTKSRAIQTMRTLAIRRLPERLLRMS